MKKFYEENWFMMFMFIVCFPVGVFLMWKYNKTMKKSTKVLITILYIYTLISGIIFLSIINKENLKYYDNSNSINNELMIISYK